MAFFGIGGKKTPKPQELVKHTKDFLNSLEKEKTNGGKNAEKILEELAKNVSWMKITLLGDAEHQPEQDNIVALANEIYQSDLLQLLIGVFGRLNFEARKDLIAVFNNLLRRQVGSRYPTVEYLGRCPSVLDSLFLGYESSDIAMNCGAMLRECAKYEPLTVNAIQSQNIWKFFKLIQITNFDIASDAFSTLKEFLTKHKTVSAEFLEKNYDEFFQHFDGLLHSENYVTRKQSLKLLGELLLDRTNFNIMTKYISDQNNLKLIMTLLRDKSRSIQFEAFHVFKVFVANPNKTPPILFILSKNKEKLIAFLSNFHNDKEDEQFNDEKAFLIKQIQQL